mmetsp:Transcript_12108/g.41152  ORF Transcript_12108/g.41152 Transcript_12108/m.41152 type:complete len:206 (+) Transcript_12108:53-670(+)|eukprot:CAMPEP_0205998054 /NCGR_PEP_ID=MMETSP1464-20131121/26_1 /ASSEMBLY_ACC=CAM_ASM_001124 /TAXON_ID=119497 /ORGANISM="Exanthemachrysis gayraliae, Strain RCC1523" /LENGTH=205 /DNA_ID=CAMNT_0053371191 /DNA_START=19 /DNA_END=636 /DNA_ORIENTATION=+
MPPPLVAVDNRSTSRTQRSAKYAYSDVILLKAVFDSIDTDGNGSVDLYELQRSLLSRTHQGSKVSKDVTRKLQIADIALARLDKDCNGVVDFDELLALMYPYATKRDMEVMRKWAAPKRLPRSPSPVHFSKDDIDEQKAIFALYDTDKSGFIERAELEARLKKYNYSKESVDNIFTEFDVNGDGRLSEAEFLSMVQDGVSSTFRR